MLELVFAPADKWINRSDADIIDATMKVMLSASHRRRFDPSSIGVMDFAELPSGAWGHGTALALPNWHATGVQ